MNYKVLYNPLSGKVKGDGIKAELTALCSGDTLEFADITAIPDICAYISAMSDGEVVMLVGGDGTINRFINDVGELTKKRDIYYYAAGNGNDFWTDLGYKRGDPPICINDYLVGLPICEVNGKRYRFINGIGYGIDGYCCEVGDALKAAGKPVNYTSIAIKGLLFGYKPCDATVTVDGVERKFKKVWIAPTMHGRYYGGGMIPTPEQDRRDPERKVSVCVMYGKGKLATLMAFPKIFKGEHVKKTKMVSVMSGHTVTVKFPRPSALQVDGETILDVTEYTVRTAE